MASPKTITDQLTILIPTFNRPADLSRLLRFISTSPVPLRISVLDSSAPPARNANRAAAAEVGLNARHADYAETVRPFEKFALGAANVSTPYCVLCADDDFLLLDRLGELVDLLERRPDAVAAHGRYLGFTFDGAIVDISRVVYAAPGLEAETDLERVVQLVRNYEALTYAVHRTPVLQQALAAAAQMPSQLFAELVSSTFPAARGKVLRVPHFTHARKLDLSLSYRYWHPVEYLFPYPARLFSDYLQYRASLSDMLKTQPSTRREGLFDLAHLSYFTRYLPPRVVDHYLDALLSDADEREAVDRAWPIFYSRGLGTIDRWRARPSAKALIANTRQWSRSLRFALPAWSIGESEVKVSPCNQRVRFSRRFRREANTSAEERSAIARAFALYVL